MNEENEQEYCTHCDKPLDKNWVLSKRNNEPKFDKFCSECGFNLKNYRMFEIEVL